MSTTKRSKGIGRKIFTAETGKPYQSAGETTAGATSANVPPTAAVPASEPAPALPQEDAVPVEPQTSKKGKKPKVIKERTTVMLYPATLSALEQLKVEMRRSSGKKVTLSDVFEEAVQSLIEKKGLSL